MEAPPRNSGPAFYRPALSSAGTPLFHAAWLFAIGILIAHFVWLRPSYLLLALAPVALLCGLAALKAQSIVWVPLATLWVVLGAWCAEMQPQPRPEPRLASLSDGLLRTVEGTVTEAGPMRPVEGENGPALLQRVDLHITSVEVVSDTEDAQRQMEGGVRLSVLWPESQAGAVAFRCGEQIRVDARLVRPQVYHDPGVWNRGDYLLEQSITSTATVNAAAVQLFAPTGRRSLSCRFAAWQHAASAKLLVLPLLMRRLPPALRMSDEDAVMLAAMVTGDRTYLTHSLRVGFERTGSFHMLVVSGLHLAIVAGFILGFTGLLRIPQVPAILLTIAASFGYALFTGFATPVERSLWMVTLYLLGRLLYRERSPLNTIGFAALCLLAISPRSLFDSGLQMTLLAVVSIGGVAAPVLENTVHPYLMAARGLSLIALDVKLAPKQTQFRVILRMFAAALSRAVGKYVGWALFPWTVRFGLRCIEAMVVSCVIELAMALPMAIYFHRITVFALPVNMLILPLLVALMPAALLTLMAAVVWPPAAAIPAAVTAVLLHIGVGMVRMFGSIAVGDFRIPGPVAWQIALFCVLLATAIVLAWHGHRVGKRWMGGLACCSLLTAVIAVVMPRPIDHPRDALLVEAIDVGQGDSLLLITPEGKTMLVDGGGLGGGTHQASQEFDVGEEVVSPVLWSRGIRHLDVVALSHAHSDHMGGLPSVLRNFKPEALWVGNNPPTAAYKDLLEEARELHIPVRALRAGDTAALGSVRINVLAPLPGYQPDTEASNNDSLVLHAGYRATSVLLEGDAEEPIERGMLSEADLASSLLKVGHHGSASSTTPEFLARVAPRWAVISCGLHNHYGHPRAEILQELEAAHVRTFSTDTDGATCFTLDGKNVSAEAFCGNH